MPTDPNQYLWDEGERLIRKQKQKNDKLSELVAAVQTAAEGDSNDAEIEALQEALDEALKQLGREDLR